MQTTEVLAKSAKDVAKPISTSPDCQNFGITVNWEKLDQPLLGAQST